MMTLERLKKVPKIAAISGEPSPLESWRPHLPARRAAGPLRPAEEGGDTTTGDRGQAKKLVRKAKKYKFADC
jgi:hypothetical protein